MAVDPGAILSTLIGLGIIHALWSMRKEISCIKGTINSLVPRIDRIDDRLRRVEESQREHS